MYLALANALLKRFTHVEIRHLPRIENLEANDLVEMAYGYKVSKDQQQEPIEVKNKRSSNDTLPKKLIKPKLGEIGTSQRHSQGTNLIEILVIKNLTNDDWQKPILTYLENPDGTTCQKIKYRALSYVLISGNLFKKDSKRSFA